MNFKKTAQIAAFAGIIGGLAAPALAMGDFTNTTREHGGVIFQLHGGGIDAPLAGSSAPSGSSAFVNVGNEHGGIVRNLTGSQVKAPLAKPQEHNSRPEFRKRYGQGSVETRIFYR